MRRTVYVSDIDQTVCLLQSIKVLKIIDLICSSVTLIICFVI